MTLYESTWHNPLDNPLINPLDNSPLHGKTLPCSRVPLTYLESLLCVWCDTCPLWSQVACKLTSPLLFPSPFPFPAPNGSPSNYVPFYDNITTSTSHSLIHDLFQETKLSSSERPFFKFLDTETLMM